VDANGNFGNAIGAGMPPGSLDINNSVHASNVIIIANSFSLVVCFFVDSP
jgi:hypothetical protein